jgi:hypothetical protein
VRERERERVNTFIFQLVIIFEVHNFNSFVEIKSKKFFLENNTHREKRVGVIKIKILFFFVLKYFSFQYSSLIEKKERKKEKEKEIQLSFFSDYYYYYYNLLFFYSINNQ